MVPEQYKILLITMSGIDIVQYAFVLGFALRNTIKYLIKQKKYTDLYLTVFYVLTILIALCRVIFFAAHMHLARFPDYPEFLQDEKLDKVTVVVIVSNDIAFWAKAALGVF